MSLTFQNCTIDRSVCRSKDWRPFHNRGPAARKLLSPSNDWVVGTRQVQMVGDLSGRRPEVDVGFDFKLKNAK